ncbi:MAG: hypothetical protein ACI8UR_002015 [Natronomonas sp.]|jgi:hypothetical protein
MKPSNGRAEAEELSIVGCLDNALDSGDDAAEAVNNLNS